MQGLGVLSRLPREIRDRIYSFILDLSIQETDHEALYVEDCGCCDDHHVSQSRTALLLVSKQIFEEARIIFFQTNDFCFSVGVDWIRSENSSLDGTTGWHLQLGRYEPYRGRKSTCLPFYTQLPYDMIPFIQYIHVLVGVSRGFSDHDVVPSQDRRISGPERPMYRTLLQVVDELCRLLQSCHNIKTFSFVARSRDELPGNIRMIVEPLRELRQVKESNFSIWGTKGGNWAHWSLEDDYERDLKHTMSLPRGSKGLENEQAGIKSRGQEGLFNVVGNRRTEEVLDVIPKHPDFYHNSKRYNNYRVDFWYNTDYDDSEDESL